MAVVPVQPKCYKARTRHPSCTSDRHKLSNSDDIRRQRNISESGRWDREERRRQAAAESSQQNAQIFLKLLRGQGVPPQAVYQLDESPEATAKPPHRYYTLLSNQGWTIELAGAHRPGIVLTQDCRFYWYSQLMPLQWHIHGVWHAQFYEVRSPPSRPGIELSPFYFADFTSTGATHQMSQYYLDQLRRRLG